MSDIANAVPVDTQSEPTNTHVTHAPAITRMTRYVDLPDLLTCEEYAAYTDQSKHTVYEDMKTGRLRHHMVGRKRKMIPKDLLHPSRATNGGTLREHRRQQAEVKLKNRLQYLDFGLIFAADWDCVGHPGSLGRPLTLATLDKRLHSFTKAAGVKRVTMHGLRHTCATLALSAGVPMHVVSRRLGHTSVKMTLDIYGHLLPDQQAEAASRIAGMIF